MDLVRTSSLESLFAFCGAAFGVDRDRERNAPVAWMTVEANAVLSRALHIDLNVNNQVRVKLLTR